MDLTNRPVAFNSARALDPDSTSLSTATLPARHGHSRARDPLGATTVHGIDHAALLETSHRLTAAQAPSVQPSSALSAPTQQGFIVGAKAETSSPLIATAQGGSVPAKAQQAPWATVARPTAGPSPLQQSSPTRPYFPGSHYHPNAPWPSLRGGLQNTGCSPSLLEKPYVLDPSLPMQVRHFSTGNSVFCTPVIGPDETLYVGSADGIFRAFDTKTVESDKAKWEFRTEECIDSTACIDDRGLIYVPSCDGRIYALDTEGKEHWRFDAMRERVGYSPSTIYWWEGNVVIGPKGDLHGGNDNFYEYSIGRDGRTHWATPTGMNVWSAPAFSRDGLVYSASFDMHAYAFDERTGCVKWRTQLGNLIAASPAVGPDGTVYIGTFGGDLCALNGKTGRIKWRVHTDGPIYGSVAIAPDGKLYVGSADGCMYAINAKTHAVEWTFYTGDALRSSASIGPDPEGKEPYLLYFGGGSGLVYALDPHGNRRWSYDTRVRAPGSEYPNINASIALGQHGIATASANGDVVYIPYAYYLSAGARAASSTADLQARGTAELPGALSGISREPTDGFPDNGTFLQYITPGGRADATTLLTSKLDTVMGQPEAQAHRVHLEGAQTLSLRLLHMQDAQTHLARFDADSVRVEITPPLAHHITMQPGGALLSIVPDELPKSGQQYEVKICAKAVNRAPGEASNVSSDVTGVLQLVGPELRADAAPIRDLLGRTFRVSHMSVYDPSIVPSFDQIGIASLSIDLRIVDVDEATGRVTAWGVLGFGASEEGDGSDGVPTGRHLFFAFGGQYRNGQILLEAAHPWFEITAFPVPLDKLRITGALPSQHTPEDGGSLVGEVQVGSPWHALVDWIKGEPPALVQILKKLAKSEPKADPKPEAKADAEESEKSGSWFAWPSWFNWQYITNSPVALWRSGGFVWDAVTRKPYESWGLLDAQRRFAGIGTYRLTDTTPTKTGEGASATTTAISLPVTAGWRRRNDTVSASLTIPNDMDISGKSVGMLLVDAATHQPLPIDYNGNTQHTFDEHTHSLQVNVRVPKRVDLDGKNIVAMVFVGTARIGQAAVE